MTLGQLNGIPRSIRVEADIYTHDTEQLRAIRSKLFKLKKKMRLVERIASSLNLSYEEDVDIFFINKGENPRVEVLYTFTPTSAKLTLVVDDRICKDIVNDPHRQLNRLIRKINKWIKRLEKSIPPEVECLLKELEAPLD